LSSPRLTGRSSSAAPASVDHVLGLYALPPAGGKDKDGLDGTFTRNNAIGGGYHAAMEATTHRKEAVRERVSEEHPGPP
jgi:hypothetical protein